MTRIVITYAVKKCQSFRTGNNKKHIFNILYQVYIKEARFTKDKNILELEHTKVCDIRTALLHSKVDTKVVGKMLVFAKINVKQKQILKREPTAEAFVASYHYRITFILLSGMCILVTATEWIGGKSIH